MAQVCKGLCERYKKELITSKLRQAATTLTGNLRYGAGQKWCTICSQFFFTDNILCSCCKTRLRSKTRSKRRV
ncbi:MAG: hypothetical protein COA77_07305 [Thaumarchaeota archaeon]|nr:MAG: hypothetical protein COA77_07305 [Nitrososphaerota archaeon]